MTTTVENIDILLADTLHKLQQFLTIPIHTLVSVFGVATNMVSMVVLSRIGLPNSMSAGVFALSLTDFLVTFSQMANCVCSALNKAYPENDINIYDIGAFGFGWDRYTCFFISSWITTMISIERCFCVVFPFQVRQMFTKTRCTIIVVFIYGVYFGLFTPFYLFESFNWTSVYKEGPNNTFTERQMFRHEFYEESIQTELIINTFGAVGMSVVCQCLLITCTVWMIYALRTSSSIRLTNADVKKTSENFGISSVQKTSLLTGRERKLVKIVLYLAVLYTLCNVPRYTVMFAQYTVLGMNEELYRNLSSFLWDVADFFGTINCSVNFFIYFHLNTHFNTYLREYFKAKC